MKLMTEELEKRFKDFPLYSQDGKGLDAQIVVKYFNPSGAGTWLITEGERQEDGDWLLFGYCHIQVWEWGYVSLNELMKYRDPLTGLGIEIDLHAGRCVKDEVMED